MTGSGWRSLLVGLVLAPVCLAQTLHLGNTGVDNFGLPVNVDLTNQSTYQLMWSAMNAGNQSPLEFGNGAISKLDQKAPGKARGEYEKGMQLVYKKDYAGAEQHLTKSISIYPQYVAAYNALGSAFLDQGKNAEARDQYAKAAELDDHIPLTFLNLGCAQLALKDFPNAEKSFQKASAIVPMDNQLSNALAYSQLMNQDYAGVLATTKEVHERKHQGAANIHYFAASAYNSQNKLAEAQHELQLLIKEDPKSQVAQEAVGLIQELKEGQIHKPQVQNTIIKVTVGDLVPTVDPEKAAQIPAQVREHLQEMKEQSQVVEAQAMCETCDNAATPEPTEIAKAFSPETSRTRSSSDGYTMRSSVDEVAVYFAATDHGKSVTDLTREDVSIRDDSQLPAVITGFRNEDQLPLRMGILIDTSESITGRFAFEQGAANKFLQRVLTHKDDLAFVVGFANSILLVQDFTNDPAQITHAVSQLAPGGGTAAWDAIAFGAKKLAKRVETDPVARILVVISDGIDNSSSTSLKECIEAAESAGVTVYTVSTRENADTTVDSMGDHQMLGDAALRVVSERTGGVAYQPGSLSYLNHSLDQLQQVIRSRYMISYKPHQFQRNGQFRSIEISAKKSGHRLRIYARKGYVAESDSGEENP